MGCVGGVKLATATGDWIFVLQAVSRAVKHIYRRDCNGKRVTEQHSSMPRTKISPTNDCSQLKRGGELYMREVKYHTKEMDGDAKGGGETASRLGRLLSRVWQHVDAHDTLIVAARAIDRLGAVREQLFRINRAEGVRAHAY